MDEIQAGRMKKGITRLTIHLGSHAERFPRGVDILFHHEKPRLAALTVATKTSLETNALPP